MRENFPIGIAAFFCRRMTWERTADPSSKVIYQRLAVGDNSTVFSRIRYPGAIPPAVGYRRHGYVFRRSEDLEAGAGAIRRVDSMHEHPRRIRTDEGQ